MPEVYGNTTGLAPSARRLLERIYRRRIPSDRMASPELVRALAEASQATKRQVGALVHRSGVVDYVIVGTATSLMLPDIGRLRAAEGRFRALRLVHTHLFGEPLTHDDLVDLTRLRLDLVYAIQLSAVGEARTVSWAFNVPTRASSGATDRDYELGGPVHYGRPEPNFAELISSLEAEFAKQARTRRVAAERAILVHVGTKQKTSTMARARASVAELGSLAESAGVDVVDTVIQLRERLDPKFVLGKGRLETVVTRAIDLDATVLIFDRELTPAQASAISKLTDLRVIDRSQLILDIFAQRAETRDGKLQVELAQLKYRLPRLGQKDDSLSRLTGGIGGRGPGETKLEIGRRRARERITHLERQVKTLAEQRTQRRRRRTEGELPTIAIVGYTNSGKSTLLNALTGADVLVENKLFATLDTRARRLKLPSDSFAIASDTVGFIRRMPEDLFAAFRSTFEEATGADLLLEVVDATSVELEDHQTTTERVLSQLGLEGIPRLVVYTKADLLRDEERTRSIDPNAPLVSAFDKSSLDMLRLAIERRLIAARSDRWASVAGGLTLDAASAESPSEA